MTKHIQFILTNLMLLHFSLCFSQTKNNDLYFANLVGKVKSISTVTINYDSTSWTFGYDTKIVSNYNANGNCFLELEYHDTSLIQRRIQVFHMINGSEQKTKKITTHAVDSLNKTISSYYFDTTGFNNSILVSDMDSTYHIRYVYEKNENGLRTKGTEYNAKNGNKNSSFEIYYSRIDLIDSIIYFNNFDKIKYIEYYFYNSFNEIEKVKYSDVGQTSFEYLKRDKHGNWTEKKTFYEVDSGRDLITRQIRVISYY